MVHDPSDYEKAKGTDSIELDPSENSSALMIDDSVAANISGSVIRRMGPVNGLPTLHTTTLSSMNGS